MGTVRTLGSAFTENIPDINWRFVLGLGPFFCLYGFELMASAPTELLDLVKETVEPMGYELVGVELVSRKKFGLLFRVYIDKETGIDVDDCANVSRQLSAVMDVEDPISEAYDLEVSSPGLDRPLFTLEHYQRFAGNTIKLITRTAIDDQRKFTGALTGVKDNRVLLVIDEKQIDIPFVDIQSARVVPEF